MCSCSNTMWSFCIRRCLPFSVSMQCRSEQSVPASISLHSRHCTSTPPPSTSNNHYERLTSTHTKARHVAEVLRYPPLSTSRHALQRPSSRTADSASRTETAKPSPNSRRCAARTEREPHDVEDIPHLRHISQPESLQMPKYGTKQA